MTLYRLGDRVPEIHETAWVAPSVDLIGHIVLGESVSVWFGTIARGDNEPIVIGKGSNLQEQVCCHTDPGYPLTVGQDCTIGHKAMLHGCTIGDGTLIGMGATILNGAVIGRGCLIGAGALVTEGKTIPDGSLVMGQPGKVVRELDEDAQAGLLASAAHYRQRARLFRTQMQEV